MARRARAGRPRGTGRSDCSRRAGADRHSAKDLGGWSTVGGVEKHCARHVSPAHRQAMEKAARGQAA